MKQVAQVILIHLESGKVRDTAATKAVSQFSCSVFSAVKSKAKFMRPLLQLKNIALDQGFRIGIVSRNLNKARS